MSTISNKKQGVKQSIQILLALLSIVTLVFLTPIREYVFPSSDLEKLVAEADSIFLLGEYEEAMILYAKCLNSDIKNQACKLGLEKCKTEKSYSRYITRADSFFDIGELKMARSNYEKALGVKVSDSFAKSMMAKCQESIQKVELEEQINFRLFDDARKTGLRLFENENYQNAKTEFESALSYFPSDSSCILLLSKCQERLRTPIEPPSSPPSAKPLKWPLRFSNLRNFRIGLYYCTCNSSEKSRAKNLRTDLINLGYPPQFIEYKPRKETFFLQTTSSNLGNGYDVRYCQGEEDEAAFQLEREISNLTNRVVESQPVVDCSKTPYSISVIVLHEGFVQK